MEVDEAGVADTTPSEDRISPAAGASSNTPRFNSLRSYAEGFSLHRREHVALSKNESTLDHTHAYTSTQPPADREPPFKSFIVTMLYSVLTVSSYTIAIPTSKQYTESFGVADTVAGLLVGMVPLLSAAIQPLLIPTFRRFPLRRILLGFCAVNIAGSALYGLGTLSGSFATVLVSRAVQGMVGGPSMGTTYIARSTSPSIRSKYMERVAVYIGLGYVVGPLLGLLTEVVVNAAGWDSDVMNNNTAPGWLMCILFFVEAILVFSFFVEPPKMGPPKDGRPSAPSNAGPGHGPPRGRVGLCYLLVYILPLNVGGWETSTVFFSTDVWGWSIESTALYIAGFNLLSVVMSLFKIERWIHSDRAGVAFAFVGITIASVFFFDYSVSSVAAQASIFGVGSFLLLFPAQTGKGFLFGLVSKFPTPEWTQKVMAVNAMCYMLGRATGSIVCPHLTNGHDLGIFLLCLNCFGLFVVFRWYNLLTVPPKTQASQSEQTNA